MVQREVGHLDGKAVRARSQKAGDIQLVDPTAKKPRIVPMNLVGRIRVCVELQSGRPALWRAASIPYGRMALVCDAWIDW